MNIHQHHEGRAVRVQHTVKTHLPLRFLPGYPGWGSPDRMNYMKAVEPGMVGVITHVSSHGMAPFTRYDVRFEDGSEVYNLDPSALVFV